MMIILRRCKVVQGEKSKRPCGLLRNPQWAGDNQPARLFGDFSFIIHYYLWWLWGVLWFAWSWPNLKIRSVDEQDDSDSLLQIGMRVKLTMHCGECLKKIAAQWILCRLESAVMQPTWRNHTSEDVNSQWPHPHRHYNHHVYFPLPMMGHDMLWKGQYRYRR